jgi:hypothetical protein
MRCSEPEIFGRGTVPAVQRDRGGDLAERAFRVIRVDLLRQVAGHPRVDVAVGVHRRPHVGVDAGLLAASPALHGRRADKAVASG